MVSLFFGLLCALLACTVIGFGPSLFLSSDRNRLGFAVAVAPVVGFVVVTIFGTYLTLLDIPVSRWTLPFLVVGAFLSLLLILLRPPAPESRATPSDRRAAIWGAAGFIFTFGVIAAPQFLGGLQFSVLRGNGTDAFNYIAAADYLDREPFSWAERADPEALADRDPTYELAHGLLANRWSTFMVLAFFSRAGQNPPYLFEYCFSLLCFLLAYGPAFLYARSLDLRPGYAALTAAAICAGFWAQVILDTRAQSQLNSIPVLLLLMLLVSLIEDRTSGVATWTVYALAGAAALSLMLLYAEIVPMVVLALFIFFVTRLRSLDLRSSRTWRYSLTGAVILVGSLPTISLFSRFVARQLSYASGGKNTWHLAYYSWLYSNFAAGFWGFGPLESSGTARSIVTSAAVSTLGVALTVLLVLALVHSLRKGSPALRLAACTALAAIIEFGYLAMREQLWAAAKGLSFGYAFFTLTLVGCFLGGSKYAGAFLPGRWQKFAVGCTFVFLIFQDVLGIWRPWLAVRKEEYAHYISHHGEYRRHSWNLDPFQKALAGQHGVTVWSDVSNGWVSEYLDFALGGEVRFVNIGADLEDAQPRAKTQEQSRLPQYLIVENSSTSGAPGSGVNAGALAKTEEFSLIRFDSGGQTLIAVSNPNGLEKTPDGHLFFWMGGKPTVFTLISSTDGCATFSGYGTLGPSSSLSYRTIVAGNGTDHDADGVRLHEGNVQWQVHVRKGFNEVPVTIKEEATQYLPADHRPLLLRVDNLKVQGETCEK